MNISCKNCQRGAYESTDEIVCANCHKDENLCKCAPVENQITVGVGKILTCSWGYSMTLVDFYEVLKESAKTLLVRAIGSKVVETTSYMAGHVVPDIEKKENEILRVYKRKDKSEKGFYLISRKSGYRKFYHVWDGQPEYFNHCD